MSASTTVKRDDVNTGAESGRTADSPLQIPPRGWKQVALRTWRQSSEDNVGLVAAGVAFYAFLALVPLLGATVLTYGLHSRPWVSLSFASEGARVPEQRSLQLPLASRC